RPELRFRAVEKLANLALFGGICGHAEHSTASLLEFAHEARECHLVTTRYNDWVAFGRELPRHRSSRTGASTYDVGTALFGWFSMRHAPTPCWRLARSLT